ncbi:MAG: GNAT family N-acetyltransferase [Saprospiraceae bacterium]
MKWKTFTFQELTLEQLYQMMMVRQEVFVVEQNCPYLDADGKDQDCYHVLGYDNDDLVAYSRIVPKGISYPNAVSIGRILTTEKGRGKGIGKMLVQFSIEETIRLFQSEKITISAQCYLTKFYENFGFQIVGESYLEDDIPHIKMIRN